MKLLIRKDVAQKIGYAKFEPFGLAQKAWDSWKTEEAIELGNLSPRLLGDLEYLLHHHEGVRGVGVLQSDLHAWMEVLNGGAASMKARTVRQFEPLLTQYLLKTPGHRIYQRHDEGAMLAYYVSRIEYHPPRDSRDSHTPAYVAMDLVFEAIGGHATQTITFGASDCRGIPVARALINKGFQPENLVLREEYQMATERYLRVAQGVGVQYLATGMGTEAGESNSWRRTTETLERGGQPARVVLDVFKEDGTGQCGQNHVSMHEMFWPNEARAQSYDPEKDVDDTPLDEEIDVVEDEVIEVPIHPWLVVFDLAKHRRYQVHVGQLRDYEYDQDMADKLILPENQKQLVKLLIDTKGGAFQDIVRSKGGGAVVLLAGPPGSGKTLTAEVYAESEEKPLYSVQCSQLGTKPEDLEGQLMRVFDRARRWNAVMLLDEADVYIHERGNNMAQNAIVGVFLRVLEYQGGVLFLTTNRPKDVDDAIASRCIARITYQVPSAFNAERIWRVLADNAGIVLDDAVIMAMVERNPGMMGRDIKNVLKLARLLDTAGEGISVDALEYVKQFQPTISQGTQDQFIAGTGITAEALAEAYYNMPAPPHDARAYGQPVSEADIKRLIERGNVVLHSQL